MRALPVELVDRQVGNDPEQESLEFCPAFPAITSHIDVHEGFLDDVFSEVIVVQNLAGKKESWLIMALDDVFIDFGCVLRVGKK